MAALAARGRCDVWPGIHRQIRGAYCYLAPRWRPGDRIFRLGYSRGAYAVRSLAGVIDLVGLVREEHASERNIREVSRHYQHGPAHLAAQRFAAAHCHADVPIEMIGAWDWVKSPGINAPLLWRLSAPRLSQPSPWRIGQAGLSRACPA